jgi:hypothetical protein
VRALLDDAAERGYQRGVLGVHAAAEWSGPGIFSHHGTPVRIAPCPSTLAVWEALSEKDEAEWLVVITPCGRDDLGGGVLAHLAGNRLRTPNPWEAVQQRFAAQRMDRQLYAGNGSGGSRELATGLLAALPADGWPPAPGGVLTRDHALGCVARERLGIAEPGMEVDITAVVAWSVRSDAATLLAGLRTDAGNALLAELIEWLAGRCGTVEGPVRALLGSGRASDLVPLGIVAGLLCTADAAAGHAAGRFAGTYGLGTIGADVLAAWHAETAGYTVAALTSSPEGGHRVLASAAQRVAELGIGELARSSDLLPAGLQARLAELAEAVRAALPTQATEPDRPAVTGELAAAEQALERVKAHHLAATDATARACTAALRLLRWLASDSGVGAGLAALARRHVDTDAWVDACVAEVARGSDEPALAEVLGAVLKLVRLRRDAHDAAFGAALATGDERDTLPVECVLGELVAPLAETQPALLLVVDGLSMSVAIQLARDAREHGWTECALPRRESRAPALAVLPTLTEFSRCSLLCGELARGDEDAERAGFAALLARTGLYRREPTERNHVPLHHKRQLDTSATGQALDTPIQTAIADTDSRPLVAAVLNAVDDALHHTDPGGIDWGISAVRHLRPLLEAARRAGRAVVITSDHGHVIEWRESELRAHQAAYGARARAVLDAEPASDGEVVVRGPRVLTSGGAAVLAVNERLRYGSLAAGYHGGGSPAEVVVPVLALYPGFVPTGAALRPLEEPQPAWWEPGAPVQRPAAEPAPPDDGARALARKVVGSRAFGRQRGIAGRIPVTNATITELLAELLAAPGHRLPAREAAAVLGVATSRLRGALSLLKRVLDVEGYVVISYEPESGEVVLDEATLREQFGLG